MQRRHRFWREDVGVRVLEIGPNLQSLPVHVSAFLLPLPSGLLAQMITSSCGVRVYSTCATARAAVVSD